MAAADRLRRHDGRFVLTDGRNRYVAALMLGVRHLFVAWLRPPVGDLAAETSPARSASTCR